jgi:hypothetical protein
LRERQARNTTFLAEALQELVFGVACEAAIDQPSPNLLNICCLHGQLVASSAGRNHDRAKRLQRRARRRQALDSRDIKQPPCFEHQTPRQRARAPLKELHVEQKFHSFRNLRGIGQFYREADFVTPAIVAEASAKKYNCV